MILVVGSINQDISLTVEHFPRAGETINAQSMKVDRGGKGANQAVSAARLGADVFFIGGVGNDGTGESMIHGLNEEGIDVNAVMKFSEPTGTAVISIDAKAENTIIVSAGANHAITISDIEKHRNLFSSCEYCVLQFELPLNVVEYVINLCVELKKKVILNPAPFNQEFNHSLVSKLAYFIPNEIEFMAFMNDSRSPSKEVLLELSKIFCERYESNLVVTLGSSGSMYRSKTECFFVDALKVKAVDTTGAGDTFIGGFVRCLALEMMPKEALEFATKASALCVMRRGAQDSIPYLKEID